MKFWNKMKKNTKGFTLVEIIVVLVILAVLAAFTIPTMLGFVNEARGKAYIAEAREVYVAAQATATEYGAKGTVITNAKTDKTGVLDSPQVISSATGASKTMYNYLDPNSTADIGGSWYVLVDTNKVTSVVYTSSDGKYTVTLDPTSGSSTVVKNS
ncbi:MAG: type pilus assembly protein PilA [Acetobacterium sp.]|nr:type pilus assembly protein PilA [Acetobacterium sp.]